MNRLLDDEGGSPSAPSFSQICSRSPAVAQASDAKLNEFNHDKRNNDSCDVESLLSRHEDVLTEEARVDDGFQLVHSKKKRKSILGSRKESTVILKSAIKTADIFVGNCDTDVTVESLSRYINDELKVKV